MGRVKLSILSPCYNGEKFIGRYLENILEQSFQNYELIIVNDGSTDKSDEIIKKYKKIFEEKKITFKYLSKLQNEGHARAINDGLKMVDGQYLMWPDIDDYMHINHLEKHVEFMDRHTDIDLAIGKTAVYNVNDLSKPLYYAWKKFPKTKKKLINKFILSENKNIGFMSGNFIIKTEFLWTIYTDRNIYSDIHVGPTIQLVFPEIYLGKTGYIEECTFAYYIHGSNQHLINEHRDFSSIQVVYENVVKQLNIESKEAKRIMTMARNVTSRLHLSYAIKHDKTQIGIDAWEHLKKDRGVRTKELIKYLILKNHILRKIYVKYYNEDKR